MHVAALHGMGLFEHWLPSSDLFCQALSLTQKGCLGHNVVVLCCQCRCNADVRRFSRSNHTKPAGVRPNRERPRPHHLIGCHRAVPRPRPGSAVRGAFAGPGGHGEDRGGSLGKSAGLGSQKKIKEASSHQVTCVAGVGPEEADHRLSKKSGAVSGRKKRHIYGWPIPDSSCPMWGCT